MKRYEFAVLIGRFQPFHNGHLNLCQHALKLADKIIIIIGSHNAPRSIRNPWTSSEREELIRSTLSSYDLSKVFIITISDSAYNFNDWVIRVQQKVSAIAQDKPVALVGHYKDDTSYYLNHFPQWHLESLPLLADGTASTQIRNACFNENVLTIKSVVPSEVFTFLEKWLKTQEFDSLQEEFTFIQNYRRKWDGAPFAPTFVTVDSVVMALGHVLLVRRGVNPGKGRLALPGGFIRADETIEKGCLRELKEETSLSVGNKELHGSIKARHVFDHPLRDPRGRVITHAFMFELNVKELPSIRASDSASEVMWFPLFRLEENESFFFNDHAQIIKFFVNRMN